MQIEIFFPSGNIYFILGLVIFHFFLIVEYSDVVI